MYIQPNTVLEWMRNILANRLATDIPSWVDTYQRFNSGMFSYRVLFRELIYVIVYFHRVPAGTYNNQNMVRRLIHTYHGRLIDQRISFPRPHLACRREKV